MAYESLTFNVILDRMMRRVTEAYPNLDTREGSIIYNALAPAAIELAIAYTELDNVLAESFVNTASREYLYLKCEEMGMDTSAFEATAGTFKGEFNVEVPIGSRWNCDAYNYVVADSLGINETTGYYEYSMICETYGGSPNKVTGWLTAITDLPSGLAHASLTDCLVEGEDELSDADIKAAYYEYVATNASDGNVSQYERWCAEEDGVGRYKVLPQWQGANTVKVSILSASNKAASDKLVSDFQTKLDPNTKGMGDGLAPIGAFVTVSTATEIPIAITCDVRMQANYNDTTVIDDAIDEYFSSIAYEREQVPYMNVGAAILAVEGVESISNLKVNGGTSDIELGNEQIPVRGATTWTVVTA